MAEKSWLHLYEIEDSRDAISEARIYGEVAVKIGGNYLWLSAGGSVRAMDGDERDRMSRMLLLGDMAKVRL